MLQIVLKFKMKIEEIQKTDNRRIIKCLPQSGKKLMGLGLKGTQIGNLQQRLANYVRENENMYAYYKARGHLEKYRKELTQFGASQAKEIRHQEKAEKLEQSKNQSQKLSGNIRELEVNQLKQK